MIDALTRFTTLRRPRLMLRAARIGLCSYRAERDLPRLLGEGWRRQPASVALEALLDIEAELEEVRRLGAADYSFTRHIELLIALMGEAQRGAPHSA